MNLKLATMEDLDRVVKLVEIFLQNSPYKDEPSDPEEIRKTVAQMLRDKNQGVVIFYMKDDVPVGFIGGLLSKMIFSKEHVATEFFWWVDPQFRNRKSLSLKEAFEFWGKRVGAKYIAMTAPADDPRVARYYERTGYNNLENSFLKKVA